MILLLQKGAKVYDVWILLFDLIDNIDFHSFRYCHLATTKLNKFNEIKSIRAGRSIGGNSPGITVRFIFIILSGYRTIIDIYVRLEQKNNNMNVLILPFGVDVLE